MTARKLAERPAVAVPRERPPRAIPRPTLPRRVLGWFANPWDRPRMLAAWTWLYIVWAILPVAIAVAFSFNASRSRSTWEGFSFRWYWEDPSLSVAADPALIGSLFQSLKLAVLTMLIATPLGVALAIGLARWRGRGARAANMLMLFPLVTPEIVMGVALFLVFVYFPLFDKVLAIHLGTTAQLLGHVTFTLSFVVIVVRGRLFAIGKEHEEAAMDLGASQIEAIRRVLLPMLAPAIFASALLAFAISVDDFVISAFLAGGESTITIPVRLYSTVRMQPTPALNALASIMLFGTLVAVVSAFLVLRRARRREGRAGGAVDELTNLGI
jgi:spermidine/putrescine transport system permease protein